MIFKIENLILECKQEEVKVDFTPNITIFTGPISAGKSTIVRLIDYCLGRDMSKKTLALQQELVSTTLNATIGSNKVQFKRIEGHSNYVEVTWANQQSLDSKNTIRAPITPTEVPIMDHGICSLSDLIFFLMGKPSIKVPTKVHMANFKQLTFRNLMWYCYLEQEYLASKFYHLLDPVIEIDSRNAMKYIIGQFTDNMYPALKKLSDVEKSLLQKETEILNNKTLLEKFGFESSEILDKKIRNIRQELDDSKQKLSSLHNAYKESTHFADKLRGELRELCSDISETEQDIIEINRQIETQKGLQAELLTAQGKIYRKQSAKNILYSVTFKTCPECGQEVQQHSEATYCPLCKQQPEFAKEIAFDESANISDIKTRLEELSESIELQQKALLLRERILKEKRENRIKLDQRLNVEVKDYDSSFLSNSRDLERTIAELTERLNIYNRIIELPKSVTNSEELCKQLVNDKMIAKQEVNKEKKLAIKSKEYIQELEFRYLTSMVDSRVPDVTEKDKIQINTHTWIPHIYSGGNVELDWTFYNAGSSGKATLVNVCYALALHEITSKHDLPLPSFLIIDTPMQHINEGLNHDIFEAFYNSIYKLAQGPLSDTQFIIIDKEFFAPKDKMPIEVKHHFIEKLIPYYDGP